MKDMLTIDALDLRGHRVRVESGNSDREGIRIAPPCLEPLAAELTLDNPTATPTIQTKNIVSQHA